MSRPIAPKHRAEPSGRRPALRRPSSSATPATSPRHRAERSAAGRRTVLLPAVALVGAGAVVISGVAVGHLDDSSARFSAELAAATASATASAGTADARRNLDARRQVRVSRSDQRPAVDSTKASRLTQEATSGGQTTKTRDLGSQDPRTVARTLMPQFGFGADQFSCLDALWNRESGWNPHAANPTSSAYGIPQALPGSKMAAAGADWADNPATQIKWGLGYIRGTYGSPCGAWSHSESYGWY